MQFVRLSMRDWNPVVASGSSSLCTTPLPFSSNSQSAVSSVVPPMVVALKVLGSLM
jgi:hypothetical protein